MMSQSSCFSRYHQSAAQLAFCWPSRYAARTASSSRPRPSSPIATRPAICASLFLLALQTASLLQCVSSRPRAKTQRRAAVTILLKVSFGTESKTAPRLSRAVALERVTQRDIKQPQVKAAWSLSLQRNLYILILARASRT